MIRRLGSISMYKEIYFLFEKVETEFLISNYIQNREGGNYMGRLSDVIGGAAEKMLSARLNLNMASILNAIITRSIKMKNLMSGRKNASH